MSIKITDIKLEFETCPITEIDRILIKYKEDSRSGVVKLIQKYENEKKKYQAELERMKVMSKYETENKEYNFICGIDEVGRGPLAGPVIAAAVILPKDCDILYLNDSKQLTEKKREELYDEIMAKAVAVGVGSVPPKRIDEVNILNATYEAMKQAIDNLKVQPDLLLNDAVTIPGVNIKQIPIIKGDAKSMSIAAASIIAKVTRDRIMVAYDGLFPEYCFASNKGYGSKEHIKALQEKGPTLLHRETFIKNFV